VHVHHLNTTDGKMSKSKGEFLTVSLLQEKGYDPLAYRLFCLQSHYRKALVFTWENLDNAVVTYNKLIAKIAALKPDDGQVDGAAMDVLRGKFTEALGNDLNTSLALTCVYDALKYDANDATRLAAIDDFDRVLSLDLLKKAAVKREADKKAAAATAADFAVIAEDGEPDSGIEAKILARRDAKKAKNFAEADRIRDELKAAGIEVTDIPNGAKWKRV
jgi:cysteinyl-tRNA synthetase